MDEIVLDEGLELVGNLLMKNLLEESDYANQQSVLTHGAANPAQKRNPEHQIENPPYLMIEPKCVGQLDITIKTQIQTNRRTNFYIDANWPEEMLNKKFPIFYYPPVNSAIHDPLNNVIDPKNVWLSEMAHYYYGTSSYMEVQFWMKLDDRMKMILKCNTHPTIIKLPGQQYDEKTISSAEAKWARNTIIFGVNFNCTRTCFKSEIYIFVRIRSGHYYMESGLVELPFRRSEKRKNEGSMPVMPVEFLNPSSKRQLLHAEPQSFEFGHASFDASLSNEKHAPLLPNIPLDHLNNQSNFNQHVRFLHNQMQQQHVPIQYQSYNFPPQNQSSGTFSQMMESAPNNNGKPIDNPMNTVPKSISASGPGFGSGHSPPASGKKPLNLAITQSLKRHQPMGPVGGGSGVNTNFANVQFSGHKTFNSHERSQEVAFFDNWDGECDIYKSSFGMDSFHHDGTNVNH